MSNRKVSTTGVPIRMDDLLGGYAHVGLETEPFSDQEDEQSIPTVSDVVVNVASVPQRSPLRYPGGKTWLIPEIRKWLLELRCRPEVFLEPFAGGGIASLTAVMEGLVDQAVMCEKDAAVSALWRTILSDSERFAERVLAFEVTDETVLEVLSETGITEFEQAFRTLVQNRTKRGGILAKGASLMKAGENGAGVASRWYPATLAKRILAIGRHADRIHFFEGDGVALIRLCQERRRAALFVDPPYTAAGKRAGRRLYTHNDIDHQQLFDLMVEVEGDFLMTYDESPEIVAMARSRAFSLAKVPMKNTHHNQLHELLITPGGRSL